MSLRITAVPSLAGYFRKFLQRMAWDTHSHSRLALSSALTRPSAPLAYTLRSHPHPRKSLDFTNLWPPNTTSDASAWDTYWENQIDSRWLGLSDMFCSDGELVDAMRAEGFETVFCVGAGISLEPHALAAAGFDVTALDLSPLAVSTSEAVRPTPAFLEHALEKRPIRPGGRLRFIVGDLRDTSLCPGPFDVIVERRTLQLFSEQERSVAIQAVAGRLAAHGIFFSHCHDGRSGPGQGRHFSKPWFEQQRWTVWDGRSPIEGRVVRFLTSTG